MIYHIIYFWDSFLESLNYLFLCIYYLLQYSLSTVLANTFFFYTNCCTFERILGFSHACNDYIGSIIFLYGEIVLLCLLILIIMGDFIFDTNFSFSKYGTFWLDKNADIANISIKSNYPTIYTKKTESYLDLLFLWLPTIAVIHILTPSLGLVYYTEFIIPETSFLDVNIVGHQWYWSYELSCSTPVFKYFIKLSDLSNLSWDSCIISYDSLLDLRTSPHFRLLNTDRHLILPTNTNVFLIVTSSDVIHSWSLNQFGVKIDAIPGKLNSGYIFSNVEGIFYGQCSELCGSNHTAMPIVVEFVSIRTFFNYLFSNSN